MIDEAKLKEIRRAIKSYGWECKEEGLNMLSIGGLPTNVDAALERVMILIREALEAKS